jgi:hypothetical protein
MSEVSSTRGEHAGNRNPQPAISAPSSLKEEQAVQSQPKGKFYQSSNIDAHVREFLHEVIGKGKTKLELQGLYKRWTGGDAWESMGSQDALIDKLIDILFDLIRKSPNALQGAHRQMEAPSTSGRELLPIGRKKQILAQAHSAHENWITLRGPVEKITGPMDKSISKDNPKHKENIQKWRDEAKKALSHILKEAFDWTKKSIRVEILEVVVFQGLIHFKVDKDAQGVLYWLKKIYLPKTHGGEIKASERLDILQRLYKKELQTYICSKYNVGPTGAHVRWNGHLAFVQKERKAKWELVTLPDSVLLTLPSV